MGFNKKFKITDEEKREMTMLMDSGELQLFAENKGFSSYYEAYLACKGKKDKRITDYDLQ